MKAIPDTCVAASSDRKFALLIYIMDRPLNIDDDIFEAETFANSSKPKKRSRNPSIWARSLSKKARVA
ncbi:unnamed protein product, partial [Allacma fusca]